MTRSGSALVVALALAAGCTEALRVPPPTDATAGAAGAPGSGAAGYAIATPPMGGGLVSGSGAAASPGSGFGPGTGGSAGHAPTGGMAAASGTGSAGMAMFPTGPMTSPAWLVEGHTQYLRLPSSPIGMSRDGTVVLGADGLLWEGKATSPASIIPTIPWPKALSSDGMTVIGNGPGQGVCHVPMLWTADGVQSFGKHGWISFVSKNGWAAGIIANEDDCAFEERGLYLLWLTAGSGGERVDGFQFSEPLGLSDEGVVTIGHAWNSADPTGVLFIASTLWGPASLGSPPGMVSTPVFMSAVGSSPSYFGGELFSSFAGTARDQSGNLFAFAWSPKDGYVILPKAPGRGQSLAFGFNGAVVAALGTNAPAGLPVLAAQDGIPFTWTAAGGTQVLSTQIFESLVMTPDASSIVGNPTPRSAGLPPVRWDQNGKPYSLLSDAPMFLALCRPVVTQISADGRTLAGSCDADARKTGFVARY